MKIGILTFHHTTNYGATIQTYALWKFINDLNYKVEVIDYRPENAVVYYQEPIKVFKKNKLSINLTTLMQLIKFIKMRFFLLSHLQLSKRKFYDRASLKNHCHDYDLVVCGSDQIWCLDSFRGFDASFFLDFIDSQSVSKKISYAASFGKTEDLGRNKNLICQLINQFDAVSVRDSNSLNLISSECFKQVKKVLDPTFLISYKNIVLKPRYNKNFLLIYNQGILTPEEEKIIKLIAQEKKLDIISIGRYNSFAKLNLVGMGVKEWLGYFSRASYIITNTYHGTIFSMIFRKPFTVLHLSGKIHKTGDLLKYLNLEKRMIKSRTTLNLAAEDFSDIDYTSVFALLEKEIIESKAFLTESLNKAASKISFT